MNDVLQVPMTKELRERATTAALAQGYSSLQESVRVFLTQLADKKIESRFYPIVDEIQLSTRAINRLKKQKADIQSGKSQVFTTHSVDQLMALIRKENDRKS